MMAAFGAYIKTITALTIFSAFTCMLMPDNSFRKYLELVLGVLVLTAVLNPFLGLLGTEEMKWELNLMQNSAEVADFSEEAFAKKEEERLNLAYGQTLNERIYADLHGTFSNVTGVVADFCAEQNDENYGNLLAISIEGENLQEEALREYVKEKYDLDANEITIRN